jgi:hypothetical protein
MNTLLILKIIFNHDQTINQMSYLIYFLFIVLTIKIIGYLYQNQSF